MAGALLMASLLLVDAAADPIHDAIERYRHVAAYQATMKSSTGSRTEILRYYFRKPGHVRMEFVQPFGGAVLIYDPAKGRARLWPFGYRSVPALSLSPENLLIQSATGQRVDRSDVGALYQNIRTMQEHGKTEVAGTELIGGKETLHVTVEGEGKFTVGEVHRYQLWLEREALFPVRISSHDADGHLIETVEMTELKINPEFPADFFEP